ncbi:MAG: phosphatidate cytidylyltransferase [Planctomycetota bacterium]
MPPMLKHRLPSGIAMIVGLLLLMWADNALEQRGGPAGAVLLGLVLVLGALASQELAALLRTKWGHCSRVNTMLSAAAGCVMIYLLPWVDDTPTAVAVFGSGVAAVLFGSMFRHSFASQKTEGAAAAGANATFAMVYLGVLPGMYLLIREAGYSAWVIGAILLVVKSCDIGAYFTGRFLGRHKLIPWLSPGKTWEGLVGGMAFAALWAVVFTLIGNRAAPEHAIAVWFAVPAGLLLGLLGQVGDLVASLLKRDAGVKDWAATIPGFGGVMDVADSLLIVAPVAYWLLVLAPGA